MQTQPPPPIDCNSSKEDLDYVYETWMQYIDASVQTDEARGTRTFPKWQMGEQTVR